MTGIWLAGFIAMLGLAGSSAAAPVTWAFDGRVEIRDFTQPVGGPVGIEQALTSLGVIPGAFVRGGVTFETSTPDSSSTAEVGRYVGAVIDAYLSIGDLDLRIGTLPCGAGNIGIASFPPPDPVAGRDTGVDLWEDLGFGWYTLMALALSSHDPTRFDPDLLDPDPPDLGTLDPFGFDDTSAFAWGSHIYLGFRTPIGREPSCVPRFPASSACRNRWRSRCSRR